MAPVASNEADPSGKSPHAPGAKLDAGKLRPGLVLGSFAKALREVVRIGTKGAEKCTDNGWREVPQGEARYTDAMHRHILDEADGLYDTDPGGTGCLHAAQVAWNALARLYFIVLRLEENNQPLYLAIANAPQQAPTGLRSCDCGCNALRPCLRTGSRVPVRNFSKPL